MAKVTYLQIFGPVSALHRLSSVMHKETPHIHFFTRPVGDDQNVSVFLYEDLNTAVQSSRCVTCIVSENPNSLDLEIADIGRQSGFRGSQGMNDEPMYDQVVEFILDYGRQFGLTVQNRKEE